MTTQTQDAILLKQSIDRLIAEVCEFVCTVPGLFADARESFRRLANQDPERAFQVARETTHARMDAEFARLADAHDWTFIERQKYGRFVLPVVKDMADDYLKRVLE